MDIVPRQRSLSTETTGYRDQNAALARDLAPIAQITEKPEVDSVVSVWPTANWLERETYDMYGIRFTGHPDLRRMLLDDEFEGYPLLKSFHQVPLTVKPRATTQVDPNVAVSGQYQQKGVEHVVQKKLGQGKEERLHPGTPTFGHSFHEHEEEANQENVTEAGR